MKIRLGRLPSTRPRLASPQSEFLPGPLQLAKLTRPGYSELNHRSTSPAHSPPWERLVPYMMTFCLLPDCRFWKNSVSGGIEEDALAEQIEQQAITAKTV